MDDSPGDVETLGLDIDDVTDPEDFDVRWVPDSAEVADMGLVKGRRLKTDPESLIPRS
jgi:hypothetical protein